MKIPSEVCTRTHNSTLKNKKASHRGRGDTPLGRYAPSGSVASLPRRRFSGNLECSLWHLWNKQLPKYCKKHNDPAAMTMDALVISWRNILGNAFPPFAMITKVVQEVLRDEVTLLLVAQVAVIPYTGESTHSSPSDSSRVRSLTTTRDNDIQWKLSITRSVVNTKQRKLIHWDRRNWFVISGILLYQISSYRVSTVSPKIVQPKIYVYGLFQDNRITGCRAVCKIPQIVIKEYLWL